MLPRIAICGAARNAGSSLLASLASIDRLASASSDSAAVIVTNDNDDDTARVLAEWAAARPWAMVIVRDGLAHSHPDRLDRLAAVRNLYIQELQSRSTSYDVLAVLDLDGPNDDLRPEAVSNALTGAPSDWIALFANQPTAYYDLFALRYPKWVERHIGSKLHRVLELRKAPLELPLSGRTLWRHDWARLNSRGEFILSPE